MKGNNLFITSTGIRNIFIAILYFFNDKKAFKLRAQIYKN